MARKNEEHAAKFRERLNAAHDELEALRGRHAAASAELEQHLADATAKFKRAKALATEVEAIAQRLKELKALKL